MKTGIEYVLDGNDYVRIDYDCLDPNGQPTITVLSEQEAQELGLTTTGGN